MKQSVEGVSKFRPWDLTIKRLPPVLDVTDINTTILEAVKRIFDVRTRPRFVNRVGIIQDPISVEDITRTEVFYGDGIPGVSFDYGDGRKSAVASRVGEEASVGRRNGSEGRNVVGCEAEASGQGGD